MESINLVNTVLVLGSALVIAGILSSLLAFRFGGPLLLVFLGIGMLAGEDGVGGLPFDDYRLTYLIGSGALAIILFDGGLRTRLGALRGALWPAVALATVGVVVTAGLTGAAAVYVLDLTWLEGLLVGAVVASTDAAAVFFLLRTGGLQLRRRVGTTLEIESATNDPAAIFLTLTLIELLLAGRTGPTWDVLGLLAQQAIIGTALGLAGGFAASLLINRVDLPSGLHPLFVAASAVLIFAATAVLGGSGFLAAYLGGLVLGNRRIRAYADIASFHDTLTWLCQIVMFIVLGLLVTPTRLVTYAAAAVAIAAFLMLVARPLAVWLCLAPFRFTRRETVFASWVGLRGAVSIFLSAIPVLVGLPKGEMYFNVAFTVVLASLLVQGWTIVPVARRLGVALAKPAAAVHRVELDLPGQLEYEMVGFPVFADSPVLRRGPLPRWARPVLVVREQTILQPAEAGPLRAGDYAYFLAPPDRASRLDRLFGHGEEGEDALGPAFPLAADTPVGALAELYGLELSEADRALTVAELFDARFESRPEVGDRIALGDNVIMTAIEVDEDRVVRAGMIIEEAGGYGAPAAAAPGSWLARLLRRIAQRDER
jgi:cell volume regulation protein A